MRMRLSLCSLAVVLLLAWLAVTAVGVGGENRFVLQVPATYLSVGQQIEPRLVSLAPSAATPAAEVTVELLAPGGRAIHEQQISLDGSDTASVMPFSLPHAGIYVLRARSAKMEQQIRLHALPDAGQGFGGVLPITALGVEPGVADYLRQHSFVVQPASLDEPAPAASRLILVGTPGLEGASVGASYSWLWQQADHGAQVLLLKPAVPAVEAFWPLAPPLRPPAAEESCSADALAPPLTNGVVVDPGLQILLRPALTFDLAGETAVDLYRWNGHLLLGAKRNARAGGGYRGCHALITYRYGSGWVTVSTLPLLEHFQDMRARLVLMNLIAAASRRKPYAAPGNGLAWVMQQRLKKLAQGVAAPVDAVYYRAPPQAVESAPVLVPEASDGNPRTCWSAPATRERGASFTLALGQARAVHALVLEAGAVPALQLTASSDGRQWQAVGGPTPAGAALPLTVPLPPGRWQDFRITLTAPAAAWRVCQLSAN